MTAIVDVAQQAIIAALGNLSPKSALERAVVELLRDAAKNPAALPDVIAWIHSRLGGTATRIPDGVSPRQASDVLAQLQLAEDAHRRGVVDLVSAVVVRLLRAVLAAAVTL